MACLAQPQRFTRYLVLGGWFPWPKVDARAVWATRRFWYQAVVATPVLGPRCVATPAFLRLIYRTWSGDPDLWSEPELEALLGQFDDPARRHATARMYRTWLTRELPATIFASPRPLDVPTLLLHGAADGCIDPLYARIPNRNRHNMTVELLPGVGHFVPEEAPATVVARALELFA